MAPDMTGAAGPSGRVPRRRRPPALALALGLALALAAAGCGDDGRTLTEPDPSQTTTSSSTPVAAGSSEGTGAGSSAASMALASPDFGAGEALPAVNTCAGDDLSPNLTLTGVPMGTADVAIVVRDADAQGFVHWVIASIPAQAASLKQGQVPEGAIEARNDFGSEGWRGPCPPSGTHHYDIRAYALAAPSGVTPGMPGAEAAALVESAGNKAVAGLSVTATAADAPAP